MSFMSKKIIFLTYICAFLLPSVPVLADDDTGPDYYPFPTDACLKALGSAPTYDQAKGCFEKDFTKRDIEGPGFSFPRLAAADLARRKEKLELSHPKCADHKVPKQFITVDHVRALADDACKFLDNKLLDTGVGTFYRLFTDTLTKSGPTIHTGANVLVSLSWALSPFALKAVGGALPDMFQFCKDTMQKLATKGQGCTGEQGGFIKGLHKTVTGGVTGTFKINAGPEEAGYVSLAYLPPDTPMD